MRYDVEVGGRLRQVNVHRVNSGFLVNVDGRDWTIDAARVDAHTLSLLIGTVSHDVTIVPDAVAGQFSVRVGTISLPVGLNSRRRWGQKDDGGSRHSGPQRVLAPMPGKIVRVLVKAGEMVRPRQPLIVIEAMKMENELRASHEGAVAELLVKEGQSVDAGALLLVVAPA